MRCAQLRVRKLATLVAVALFIATSAVAGLPRPNPAHVIGRVAAEQASLHHPPLGRRWF